jgi:aerobic-type carbon monoxide dehydrogenase small subunit (CoxS/CutS family)
MPRNKLPASKNQEREQHRLEACPLAVGIVACAYCTSKAMIASAIAMMNAARDGGISQYSLHPPEAPL